MSYRPNQRSTPEGAKVNGRYLYIFFRDPSSLRSVGMTSIGHPWLKCHIFYFFYKIREYFLDLCAACAYNGYKSKQ